MHIALFLFLIFYNVFEEIVPLANYWDELAAALVVCWGGWHFLRTRELGKGELVNWIFLAALVVIGALGNLFHPGLQDAKVAIVKDVVALCKFPAIFLMLERRSTCAEKQEKIIADIARLSRWIVAVTPFLLLLGWFVDLGFYTDDIRILPSCTFIFTNPTFFISSYVMIAAALMAESIKKNRFYLLLDCLIIFMAQRSKGYIFIAFVLLFVILGEKWVSKVLTMIFGTGTEKLKIGRLLLAAAAFGIVIFVVGRSRIERFLALGMASVRVAMHVMGVKIMMDFFPLGSGFGTYGSYLSGEYYSNLYAMYGMDRIWGMTKDHYPFISDVFWPCIYGQFGIFGLLIYVKLIFSAFIRQFHSGISDNSRIAVAAVWIYALIATTSEAYFTNGTGVQMALFLGLLIGYADRKGIAKTATTD